MAKKPAPTEKRIVLPGVSWQQFETLLDELGQNRTARLSYDRGKLEMMTPLEEHERCSRLIESLMLVVADEMDVQINAIGSVLLKSADLGCVAQPDSSYYLTEKVRLLNRAELDLNQTPPPDIVVEVAITKSSLNKFAIYAALGLPEVWQYWTTIGDNVLKGNLLIYQLQNDQYVECLASPTFPFLPAKRVSEFLDQSDKIGLAQALTVFRSWIQEQRSLNI
ncbi:MAG: Uma2 family endonuclease [Phormidesmis sp. CAN_BIN36]|nr:Uma2 family endonuclease [Phormidesmis sp. CAN_BIN36]